MNTNQIKAGIKYGGKTINEIAQILGYSRQNLNRKINGGTLTDSELQTIAEAINAKYKTYFEFKDGTQI